MGNRVTVYKIDHSSHPFGKSYWAMVFWNLEFLVVLFRFYLVWFPLLNLLRVVKQFKFIIKKINNMVNVVNEYK